jgi:hypothetical protein
VLDPVAALAAELRVDGATAQRIHALQQAKQRAVDAENYDEAKRFKIVIDRLKAVGRWGQRGEGLVWESIFVRLFLSRPFPRHARNPTHNVARLDQRLAAYRR